MKKIAVVTGAGSGIGRGVSIGLLNAGYTVVLAGRRVEPLHETVKLAHVPEEQTLVIPTDVSVKEEVVNLFAQVKSTYGRLNLLFNNAGVSVKALPLEEVTFEDWATLVGANLTGPFLCTQEAVKIMKDQDPQGGRIINNGSISAQVPRPHAAPYNITKTAITGLTRSTQLEGRAFNIVCGQVDIGNVATDMTQKMSKGVIQADGSIKKEPTFDMEHLVEAFLYMAQLPLTVNVPFITVMANGMPYMGRG